MKGRGWGGGGDWAEIHSTCLTKGAAFSLTHPTTTESRWWECVNVGWQSRGHTWPQLQSPPPFHSFPFLRFPFPSIATSVYYGPSFCQPQTCPCHPNPYSLNHSEEGGLHWCSLSLARSLSLHYPQIHRLHLLHSFLPWLCLSVCLSFISLIALGHASVSHSHHLMDQGSMSIIMRSWSPSTTPASTSSSSLMTFDWLPDWVQ